MVPRIVEISVAPMATMMLFFAADRIGPAEASLTYQSRLKPVHTVGSPARLNREQHQHGDRHVEEGVDDDEVHLEHAPGHGRTRGAHARAPDRADARCTTTAWVNKRTIITAIRSIDSAAPNGQSRAVRNWS